MNTIDDLIVSLDLDNKTLPELFDLLETVSQAEINNTKSISVLPLPTVVRDKETELKRRMIDIVVNDEKGAYAVLNNRIAIIKAITERIKLQLGENLIPNEDNEYSLGNEDNYWKEAYIYLANLWEANINSLVASVASIENLKVDYLKGLVIPMPDDDGENVQQAQLGTETNPFAKIVANEIVSPNRFDFNRAEGESIEVGKISYCEDIGSQATPVKRARIETVNSDYVNVNQTVDTYKVSASSVETVEATIGMVIKSPKFTTTDETIVIENGKITTPQATIGKLEGNELNVGVEAYLKVTPELATYKGSELGTHRELALKYDTSAHNEFAGLMETKHNQMIAEHNSLASNLQAQINVIKEALESDDDSLDSFKEIIAVLKDSTADIEAIFNQLSNKANTSYVDAQNQLDRAYTDTQVRQARSDFADQMQTHEATTQNQINELEEFYKSEFLKYLGEVPQRLADAIEVTE